jgi:hypothetical protein
MNFEAATPGRIGLAHGAAIEVNLNAPSSRLHETFQHLEQLQFVVRIGQVDGGKGADQVMSIN